MPLKLLKTPYIEGRTAANTGKSYTECPYPFYTLISCVLWHEGWSYEMSQQIKANSNGKESNKNE